MRTTILLLVLIAVVGFCPSLALAQESAATNAQSKDTLETTPSENADDTTKKTGDAGSISVQPTVDELVVTVSGKEIKESEIEANFQQFIQSKTKRPIAPEQLDILRQRYRKRIIESLIREHLLDFDAQKEKIAVTEKDMDENLERMVQKTLKQNTWTRKQFEEQVQKREGISLADYLARIKAISEFKKTLLNEKMLRAKYPDAFEVSEAEISEDYQKNLQTLYKKPGQIRASHILVDTQKAKTEEEKTAAKKKIENIMVKVKQPKADFAQLARQYSEGPSAPNGGDLGFFPRKGPKAMVEKFGAAAFALQPGQISQIVQTQFGYHIIKVSERKQEHISPLAEVKEYINAKILDAKKSKADNKYYADLKQKAKIVYHQEAAPAAVKPQMIKVQPEKTEKTKTTEK